MKTQSNGLRFTANQNVASSVHDDGIVLLHIGDGHMFASNAAGARIWRGVEQRQSLEAIVNGISDEFQIGRTTARADVVGFLAELERHALIQRQGAL